MAPALHNHHLALVFGLLGNIVSFFVFLAPLPTFYRIVKEKSTQGFQSIPYSVALFSAMLYLYYASLKVDALMLITINSVGCLIESTYLIIFLIYAPKSVRRLVIKTKSVEFMPFSLSLLLTLCAVFWLIYGLALDDYYIAVSFVTKQTLPSSFSGTILKVWLFWLQAPNILGFAFGLTQMGLYLIYRNKGKTEVLPAADNSTRSQPTTKLPTTTHDLLVSDEDKSKNVVISVTITKLEAEEEEEEEAAAKAKGKQYLGDQTLVDEPKKEERPTDLNV
ncbi:Bidirectional sugar transporter SWEET14 [Linum grandiflorum]